MDILFNFPSLDQFWQSALWIVIFLVAWAIVRRILRLAFRIFACGASVILFLGLIYLIIAATGGS